MEIPQSRPSHYMPHPGFLAFIFYLIFLARLIPFFVYPSLFAEEGTVFFARVLSGEWDPSHGAYLQVFAFGSVWLTYHVSPAAMPWLLVLIASSIQAASYLYLLLPHWERVLPLAYRCAFVFFGLCLGPYHEGLGTVLHSYFFLGFGTFFLFFELVYFPELSRKYLSAKLIWIFFAGISGLAAAFAVIGFLIGFICTELFKSEQKYGRLIAKLSSLIKSPQMWVLTATIGLQIISLNSDVSPYPNEKRFENLVALPQAIFHHIHMRNILARILPLRFLTEINHSKELALVSLLLSFPLLFALISPRRSQQAKHMTYTVLVAGVSVIGLIFLSRPFFFNLFRKSLWNVCLLGDRYNIIPSSLILLALLFGVANTKSEVLKKGILIFFLPLLIWTGSSRFFAEPMKNEITPWAEVVKSLMRIHKGQSQHIDFSFRSGKLDLHLDDVAQP